MPEDKKQTPSDHSEGVKTLFNCMGTVSVFLSLNHYSMR